MRVIILNQFFYPDYSATSLLMTDLAEGLVERGVQTTIVAGRGLYRGGKKLPKREQYKGVNIERCWVTSFGKATPASRLADYLSFYVGAMWQLLRVQHHDVVMSLTTPPLIGLVGFMIGRLRGMRVVALEQDMYPEVAIALGTLNPDSIMTRLLRFISTGVLQHSDRIIALSECMRLRLAAKLKPTSKLAIDVIHNWADGQIIRPSSRENWFTREHKLAGRFVVLFAGNFGRVNDFATVLKAASILSNNPNILFLFVGGGDKSTEIESVQKDYDLKNIQILPYHPPSQMGDILAAAHVSLVTLATGLAGLSVPSKLYWSLAAGRPVLFVGDLESESAQIVASNLCGASVAAGNSQKLAEILISWAKDADLLSQMGSAAREVFERRFDRHIAVDAYVQALRKSLPAYEY